MHERDRKSFLAAMQTLAAIYAKADDKQWALTRARAFWPALERYELADVEAAIQAHIADPDAGRFPPTPAHLIAAMPGARTLAADEAWALALQSFDEAASVMLNDDIIAARDTLKAQGARVLGTGEPKIGAHGKPVLFLHPKDFLGTLVELEQV